MSPPPPMVPCAFAFPFISPVAGLITAYIACLSLRGRAVNTGCLVEDPRPFSAESLWEKPKHVVFLRTRRQAKDTRRGVRDPHISIPRHPVGSQYQVLGRWGC